MGGYGSGRRSDRGTVDAAIRLNINRLVRDRLLVLDAHKSGILRWIRQSDGRELASCRFSFDTTHELMTVKLHYTYNGSEEISPTIRLTTIPMHFGGRRLYFICPRCGRRTWYLYLRRLVRCRKCHNLTYQSCRDSHKFDAFYAQMAIGTKWTIEDFRRASNFYVKRGKKEREKKQRLSRRGRRKKLP